MGLTSFSILDGAASIAASGGTAKTYSTDGQTVQDGIHVIDASVTDFRVRPEVLFKTRRPIFKNGRWNKDKKGFLLVEPILLADGTTEYNSLRVERLIHPETTDAKALSFNTRGAQLLTGASQASYWSTGSTV